MSNENSDIRLDFDRAKRIARQQLQSLKSSGLNILPRAKGTYDFTALMPGDSETDVVCESKIPLQAASATSQEAAGARQAAPKVTSANAVAQTSYDSEPLGLQDRNEQLSVVQTEVAGCTKCSELVSCRKNTVFGVGNPQAQLCFLGEGPGVDEDRMGEPFVGAAGQLLNKIIEACKMSRDEVYILNTVKCRPPGNRNPDESELENCWPYAIRQLEILQPQFICCLGSVAARTLLQTKQSIGRMRGQFFSFRGSQVAVTYHPAYLLRNPSAKRQVWDDMKILMAAMGRSV